MPRPNLSQEEWVQKVKLTHGDKYDYSLVEYKTPFTKVKLICNTCHHIFEQVARKHLYGQGCIKCRNTSYKNNNFIQDAIIIHNDKYDYSLVEYVNARTKVKIMCKIHKIVFEQTPSNHLSSNGCPLCNSSKGELKTRAWLIENNIIFESQKTFNNCVHKQKLQFDFYIPILNLVIEFDGKQHYCPFSFNSDKSNETKIKNLKLVQSRDNIKNKYCIDNNIKLIRIPYWDINNIDYILRKEIIN